MAVTDDDSVVLGHPNELVFNRVLESPAEIEARRYRNIQIHRNRLGVARSRRNIPIAPAWVRGVFLDTRGSLLRLNDDFLDLGNRHLLVNSHALPASAEIPQ